MRATPPPTRAKLFRNGRSQAVRLPKEFRFAGKEVLVRKEGEAVVLEPVGRARWPRGYWERLREARTDFEAPPLRPELQGAELDEE